DRCTLVKARLPKLAEDFNFSHPHLLRKQVACQYIVAAAQAITRIPSAEPVIVGKLTFDCDDALVGHLFLHKKVRGRRRVVALQRMVPASLALECTTDGEQVLCAIVVSVQV